MKSATDWQQALETAKKSQEQFEMRGDKIVKRYKNEKSEKSGISYNILWSNVRILLPAVYGKKPKAQAERRNKDKDPIARASATMLERCLQYEIDHYSDYDASIRNSVLDRYLVGRGAAWVRFESDETMLTDDAEMSKGYESKECSPTDYIYWKDFRHSPSRTWEEVTWVARRVYMSKDEGVERFGDAFKSVELKHVPIGIDKDDKTHDHLKKGIVWEIWDKSDAMVYWIGEGYQYILDEKEDPLKLDCFFPCPKPLFATLATDDLMPVADYIQYQDQANELDEVTARINSLVRSCKIVGVRDASAAGVERMLNEGVENELVPVKNWAAFSEKGGLKGSVDFLPLDMVINTLQALYLAREQIKTVIYEITGISDVIRGSSNASETATAQNIKSQYASLTLKDTQNDVARFASDLLRIKAQIIAKLYSPQTIVQMSGIQNTMDGENGQLVMQAIDLLKTDSLRNYSIEVASDSLVEIDQKGEQESRVEFLSAVGGFIKEAVQAPPEFAPLLGELLMFGVRGFKVGSTLEGVFDEAMEQMKQPKPQSDPMAAENAQKQGELELKSQLEQGKAALEQQKAQFTSQIENAKLELEKTKQDLEAEKTARQFQMDKYEADLDAEIKLRIAEMQRETGLKTSASNDNPEFDDEGNAKASTGLSSLIQSLNDNHSSMLNAQSEMLQQLGNNHAGLVEALTRPKVGTLSNGKQIRIE